MRILLTITPRLYRETLALSIHRRHPDFDVLLALPWALDGRAERFDPQLVVCSRPNTLASRRCAAWVELPLDPTRPTKICVAGRCSKRINPPIAVLLAVIDEVEQLLQTNNDLDGC